MQKERDSIDIILGGCFEEIETKASYNSILMEKVEELETRKSAFDTVIKNRVSLRISAASLIMGGLMILLLGMPSVQYRLIDYQCKIKNVEAIIQYNYNEDFLKYFKGE